MVIFILFIIFFGISYNRKFRERENAHQLTIKKKELELLKAVIETQENEREKIAANLHDEVGPLLSALKFRISKYRRQLEKETLTVEKLDEEDEYIDQILENVRSASHDLSPHFLMKFGLVDALQKHIEKFDHPVFELKANFSQENQPERFLVTNIYRILLELVHNILKYEHPEKISILLDLTPAELFIELKHDGPGIDNKEFVEFVENSTGLGLNSIKSRLILVDGSLNFAKENRAATVRISIPIRTNEPTYTNSNS